MINSGANYAIPDAKPHPEFQFGNSQDFDVILSCVRLYGESAPY